MRVAKENVVREFQPEGVQCVAPGVRLSDFIQDASSLPQIDSQAPVHPVPSHVLESCATRCGKAQGHVEHGDHASNTAWFGTRAE